MDHFKGLAATIAAGAFLVAIFAALVAISEPAHAQTTVTCVPVTYWCTDQWGNTRVCTRRVCG